MTITPRSQINQVFQMGAEPIGTPGVGGAADQRLGTFNSQIAPVASGTFGVFRPSGGKYVGQIVPTDIYAEGAFTDTIDFNTLPFLAAGNVGYVTPTGTTAITWVFEPVPFGAGTQRTYVAQEGEVGFLAEVLGSGAGMSGELALAELLSGDPSRAMALLRISGFSRE